jgi:hypothetical protein
MEARICRPTRGQYKDHWNETINAYECNVSFAFTYMSKRLHKSICLLMLISDIPEGEVGTIEVGTMSKYSKRESRFLIRNRNEN